jgi:hypothetical protein
VGSGVRERSQVDNRDARVGYVGEDFTFMTANILLSFVLGRGMITKGEMNRRCLGSVSLVI